MSGPTRYGPSTPIAGSSGMTGREVRAFGHPRYNDPDSVSGEFVEVEEMNYENSIRDRENIENNRPPSRGPASLREMNYENSNRDRENNRPPSRGPASLREMVRDVVTKGPSTIKRMYYGRGKKKKTRRTNKKRKTRRHKKTRKSRRS